VLAVDARDQLYLAINRSGALLWELLARGTSREELIECLVHEFDLGPATAAADVDVLLEELSARDLLTEASRMLDPITSAAFAPARRRELRAAGARQRSVRDRSHELRRGGRPAGRRHPSAVLTHLPRRSGAPRAAADRRDPQSSDRRA
jgi:hypothetical protein